MKDRLTFAVRIPIILIVAVLTGMILLNLVFLIPVSPIEKHVKETIPVFAREGIHPTIVSGSNAVLDNYTDCLMLFSAMYEGPESVTEKAMQVVYLSY